MSEVGFRREVASQQSHLNSKVECGGSGRWAAIPPFASM